MFFILGKGSGFLLRKGDKGFWGPAMESLGTGARGVLFRDWGFGVVPTILGRFCNFVGR